MAAYSPQLSTNVPYLNVFLIHQSRIHISLSLYPDLNCWPDRFAACYPECIDVRSLHHNKYHGKEIETASYLQVPITVGK